MSGERAGWGSMAVLEDFFDGVVGEDITKERVQALDPERGADLIARLCDVMPPKDPGLAGVPNGDNHARWILAPHCS